MTFSAGLLIERGLMERSASDGPGMFAMPDAETITPLVTEAGFGEARTLPVDPPVQDGRAIAIWC